MSHSSSNDLFSSCSGTQCFNGWYSYKTGCYHLVPIGDPWNLVTWAQANQTCSAILQGTSAANQRSHLLFIETADELVRILTCPYSFVFRGSSIGGEFAWHASGPEFDLHVRHILSWRLGHENISTAILPLPLIQEEQLSVTGERMCTKYW